MTVRTPDDAVALARRYLDAMETRNLDEAAICLSADAVMTFPGGAVLRSVDDIVRNSAGRYARIGKAFETWDAFESAPGRFIVYARGTLQGEWKDGQAFSGIRFIDRFEIESGAIRRQDVWNDMGEYRLAAQRDAASAT
jgi:hypothetical protein